MLNIFQILRYKYTAVINSLQLSIKAKQFWKKDHNIIINAIDKFVTNLILTLGDLLNL